LFSAPPSTLQLLGGLHDIGLWIMAGLLALTLVARQGRRLYRNRRGVVEIEYPAGRKITVPVGHTILEASRAYEIPHASVCGGRGRCTTCRVAVEAGLDDLPAPEALEAKALRRIKADPNVRLACQTRPRRRIAIAPLLPPNATARDGRRPGGVQGKEQQVAILFVDLRASTKLGEERLPYDVVFILNQFFAEMAEALQATGGHYAQFNGDGLMALYGMESGYEAGCREAIRGAIEMQRRIDGLNKNLGRELAEPLRIGVGVHSGEAIVGSMGPLASPIISAIGDNVNVSARLEGMTKNYQCAFVVSAETAERAGIDLSRFPRHDAELRGREETIAIYAVPADAEIEV
jgi:adenylate cyclase